MRHYFALGTAFAIPGLAGGVTQSTGAAALIPLARGPQRRPSRAGGTGAGTVPLPAIANAAEEEQLLTGRSGTDDQPERVHAPPRSGRGGWTMSGSCARKEAASRALPTL